jgi:excinuclease ABC subunit B
MLAAADELRFEYAARLRDEIRELKRELDTASEYAGERSPDVSNTADAAG